MFVILLIILMSVSAQTAKALTSGDYTYEITDGQATITGYSGPDGDVVIPSTIDGYQVTAIGLKAFFGHTLITSITIPEGVVSVITSYSIHYTKLYDTLPRHSPSGLGSAKLGLGKPVQLPQPLQPAKIVVTEVRVRGAASISLFKYTAIFSLSASVRVVT